MRISELKKELASVLGNQARSVKLLSGNDNPNVVCLRREHEAKAEMVRVILSRINGDRVGLYLYM